MIGHCSQIEPGYDRMAFLIPLVASVVGVSARKHPSRLAVRHCVLSSDGATLGGLYVPPFRLSGGDLICLHMPGLSGSPEEETLVAGLTEKQPVPGLHRSGEVAYVVGPMIRAGIFGLLRRPRALEWFPRQPRAKDWLRRAGVAPHNVNQIMSRLGIKDAWRVMQLDWRLRTLLALEVAWSSGKDAILFSTVGCPRKAIFDAVSPHLQDCPAIHLSYEYECQGAKSRDCPANALCIDVRRRPVANAVGA